MNPRAWTPVSNYKPHLPSLLGKTVQLCLCHPGLWLLREDCLHQLSVRSHPDYFYLLFFLFMSHNFFLAPETVDRVWLIIYDSSLLELTLQRCVVFADTLAGWQQKLPNLNLFTLPGPKVRLWGSLFLIPKLYWGGSRYPGWCEASFWY